MDYCCNNVTIDNICMTISDLLKSFSDCVALQKKIMSEDAVSREKLRNEYS